MSKLTPDQKETLRGWVASGAEYQAHWAYIAPVRPAIPAVHNQAWVRNPVDAFILQSTDKQVRTFHSRASW